MKIKPILHRFTLRIPHWVMEEIDKDRSKSAIPVSRNVYMVNMLAEYLKEKEKK